MSYLVLKAHATFSIIFVISISNLYKNYQMSTFLMIPFYLLKQAQIITGYERVSSIHISSSIIFILEHLQAFDVCQNSLLEKQIPFDIFIVCHRGSIFIFMTTTYMQRFDMHCHPTNILFLRILQLLQSIKNCVLTRD